MKPFASSAILFFGSTLMVAVAQPAPPIAPAPDLANPTAQTVTTHSSIRGFSAGPDGAPRTLFLSNGDAVELGPRFGNLPSGELRKGERIEVTGTSTKVANQRTIDASTVRVGSQTYMAMAAINGGPSVAAPTAGGPPPPPDAGPGGPPPPPVAAAGPAAPPPPTAPRGPRGVAPPPPPPCITQPSPVGAGAPVPPPPAIGAPASPPPADGAVAPPLPAGTPPPPPQP